jgi:hypothetical protein
MLRQHFKAAPGLPKRGHRVGAKTDMELLANEHVITTSNKSIITLSNQRIILNQRQCGSAYYASIFLENISSIEIVYSSSIIYLLLALIAAIGGVATYINTEEDKMMVGGFIFAAAFVLLWVFTRNKVISVSSNGGSKLNFVASGMSTSGIDKFINDLSRAQKERVETLSRDKPQQ